MTNVPVAAPGQRGSDTAFQRLLATTSSDALLDAADALRAWGAENDSEDIKSWVARRLTVQ